MKEDFKRFKEEFTGLNKIYHKLKEDVESQYTNIIWSKKNMCQQAHPYYYYLIGRDKSKSIILKREPKNKRNKIVNYLEQNNILKAVFLDENINQYKEVFFIYKSDCVTQYVFDHDEFFKPEVIQRFFFNQCKELTTHFIFTEGTLIRYVFVMNEGKLKKINKEEYCHYTDVIKVENILVEYFPDGSYRNIYIEGTDNYFVREGKRD